MADHDPSDIPDLVVPPRLSHREPVRGQPAIDLGPAASDDFEMEIERGGALVSLAPATGRSIGPAPLKLELAQERPAARHAGIVSRGPSLAEKVLAWAIPLTTCVATTLGLAKLVHRPGGLCVLTVLPSAFDASSARASGGVALGALALTIAVGYLGFRAKPRSFPLVGSAASLLVVSLATVTVTLVATEEQPTPPDGALLVPYAVPLAVVFLGIHLTGRAVQRYLAGSRALAVLIALLGGALLFVAIEISAIAPT